ncbi:hypothetical protein KXR75_28770 [Neorhizobium petrolearium]
MAKQRDAKKEALLNRLARIQDDIERLSQLDQTPDVSRCHRSFDLRSDGA